MVSYYAAPRDPVSPDNVQRNEGEAGALLEPVSYYARENRRRNRLLRDQLRGQADPNGILELAAERGASWDSIGLSTALHALAWKVKKGAPKPDLSDRRWQHLQVLAYGQLAEGEARNLANTAWSMANISSTSLPFMTKVAELAQDRADEFKPQEMSNLLWSFATVRYKDPLLCGLSTTVQRFSSLAEAQALSCQDAANMMWAFASLMFGFTEAADLVTHIHARSFVVDFKPQECANTLWAMAILDIHHHDLVESIASRALEILVEFRSQNISNLLWAYAKIGHRNNSATEAVLEFSMDKLHAFSAQDLTTMVWACATMDYCCQTFWELCRPRLEAIAQVSPLRPQHLSNTVWSLATLQLQDKPWFDFSSLSLPARIQEFKPQELANFIWSQAVILCDSPAVACIVLRASQIHSEFSCQSMANFTWAYAKLGYQSESMIAILQEAAATKIDRMSEQDLSTTFWAFSTMQHRDDRFVESFKSALMLKLHDRPIKSQHASNILWALASVLFQDAPFFHAIGESVKKSISTFTPQDLSCSIWALATVVYSDPSLTDLIASAAQQQMDFFDPQSLGQSAWGAAYLKTSVRSLYAALESSIDKAQCLMTYNDKVIAMLVRAFLTAGEVSRAWKLFDNMRRLGLNPGITALGAWLHHCRNLQPCTEREMQAMDVLSRFQPCRYIQEAILNSCALRLAEAGWCSESESLVQSLLSIEANPVTKAISTKLSHGAFAKAKSMSGQLHLPHWTMPARGSGHSGTDYDKQCRLLQHVLCTAREGDPVSVVNTIENFSVDGNGWLKIAGGGKGVVLDDLVTKLAPQPVALVLEFGCFVGYSCTRMAYQLVRGKVVSIEVDPIHACIARNVVEFAGVADRVSICIGYSEDVIPHLKDTCGGAAADAVFFDQRGTRFHTDLQMLEAESLLKDKCVICADNVLKPGAPHFLWYLQNSPMYDLTVVSLREFAADRIEDWMAIGRFSPEQVSTAATPFFPPSLDWVAFLTDKAAWARHSQAIRKAVGQEMPASEEVAVETASEQTVAAARGSAVFAARSLLEKDGKPTRPMSSPALLAQPREPRVVAIRPRQIKSASMARQSMPGRSRPASGISRSRKAGGWEKSDIGNSQAELWLIKQRTLAGMLWPPMSEAARGRRPGAGCARPMTKAISDQQGCGCKPQEVQPLALRFAMAEAEILHEGEAS